MTPEEMQNYLEMLRRNEAIAKTKRVFESALAARRRDTIHAIYRGMGFEVVMDDSLKCQPAIDVRSRFVDVDKDFYERS